MCVCELLFGRTDLVPHVLITSIAAAALPISLSICFLVVKIQYQIFSLLPLQLPLYPHRRASQSSVYWNLLKPLLFPKTLKIFYGFSWQPIIKVHQFYAMYLTLYDYTVAVVTTLVVVDVLVLEKLNQHGCPDHIFTSENESGLMQLCYSIWMISDTL